MEKTFKKHLLAKELDLVNNSYIVKRSAAEQLVLDPNLAFPSLGLTLANSVIPFDSNYGPPNACNWEVRGPQHGGGALFKCGGLSRR